MISRYLSEGNSQSSHSDLKEQTRGWEGAGGKLHLEASIKSCMLQPPVEL